LQQDELKATERFMMPLDACVASCAASIAAASAPRLTRRKRVSAGWRIMAFDEPLGSWALAGDDSMPAAAAPAANA